MALFGKKNFFNCLKFQYRAFTLTIYLIETPFNTFANGADSDQAALTLFAYGNIIRYDPTLVDLTSNFFILCTNAKVYLYNYS